MEQFSEREMLNMQSDNMRNPNQMMYDSMNEEKIVNVISQLNPDNLLSDIEYRLRGYKKNHFTGNWERLKGHREISEILIARFISFLGGILNDNTRFSNYGTQEINNIMEQIIEFIRDDLTDNDELYGLSKTIKVREKRIVEVLVRGKDGTSLIRKEVMEQVINLKNEGADYDEMTRIGHIICINVFSVLKRALNGTESRRIFGALRVTESLNQNEKKKGIFDAIQFWK